MQRALSLFRLIFLGLSVFYAGIVTAGTVTAPIPLVSLNGRGLAACLFGHGFPGFNNGPPSIDQLKFFKLQTFNLNNLYIPEAPEVEAIRFSGKSYATAGYTSPEQAQRLAEYIAHTAPDILVVQEARGFSKFGSIPSGRGHRAKESLERLLEHPNLKDGYSLYMDDSLVGRPGRKEWDAQQIGFIVKNGGPFSYSVETNLNHTWNYPDREPGKFLRDVPALFMRPLGALPDSPPLAIILGYHALAPVRRTAGGGREIRSETDSVHKDQDYGILILINKYRVKYGDIPVIVAGDYNRDMSSSSSKLDLFSRFGLQNSFGQSAQVPNKRKAVQFDGFLVNNALQNFIHKASVSQDPWVNPMSHQRVSDHWPAELILDFKAFYEVQRAKFAHKWFGGPKR